MMFSEELFNKIGYELEDQDEHCITYFRQNKFTSERIILMIKTRKISKLKYFSSGDGYEANLSFDEIEPIRILIKEISQQERMEKVHECL